MRPHRSAITVAVAVALALASSQAAAQPTDAQVKRDVTSPGAKKIELTKKTGTKQWNPDVKTFEYVRGVEITREYKDIDGVDLLVVGDAVYQQLGRKWKYWKFRVIENRYSGLPDPTPDEIMAIVGKDLKTLVSPYWYGRIVGDVRDVRLADEPRMSWASPNRVTFLMHTAYDAIVSNTDVESVEQDYEVNLYRDDHKAPWKPTFVSTARDRKTLGKKTYTAAEVSAMKTLGHLDAERQATAARDALPAVDVPEMKTPQELVRQTHLMLRHGDPQKLEAFLLKVMAPSLFIEGSDVQLNQRGADLINQNAARAYQQKGTYALEYCEDPIVDSKRSSPTRIYLNGVINNVSTQIAFGQFGGTFKEGVKVGQTWKITDLHVGVRSDQEALDFINSFSDRAKLCPKDPPGSR